MAKNLILNTKDERVHSAFKDVKFIHAYRQPPNLLHCVSNSTFIDNRQERNLKVGCFKCHNKRCKICSLYLQEGSSFVTANGTNWQVKCFIDCNSMHVIYYLVCCFCDTQGILTSYAGKTDNLRKRINNHITGCRLGSTKDNFDNHVYRCAITRNLPAIEPFFKLYMFMAVSDYNKLRNYESKLHSKNHDTMNGFASSN